MKILKKLLRITLLISLSLTVSSCSPYDEEVMDIGAQDWGEEQYKLTSKGEELDAKFGVIGKKLDKVRIILPAIYDEISWSGERTYFSGYIKAFKDGRCGVFNETGKPIVPIQYEDLVFMGKDPKFVKVIENDKYGLIDLFVGKIILPTEYSSIELHREFDRVMIIEKSGKIGLLDSNGIITVPVEYDRVDSIKLTRDFCYISKNNKNGVVDKKGHIIIPAEYDRAEILHKNDRRAEIRYNEHFIKMEKNKKFGLFSGTGKMLVPAEYDDISNFNKSLFCVRKGGKYGIINNNGEIIIPAEYHDFSLLGTYSNIIVVKKFIKYGLINMNGEIILPAEYDNIDTIAHSQYNPMYIIRVKKGDKSGFINREGKIVLPVEYDELIDFSDGYTHIKKDGKLGCFNRLTTKIIAPAEYDEFILLRYQQNSEYFSLFKVKKNNKFGLMNTEGKIITPIEYDMIKNISNNLMIAKKGGKDFFIDITGKAFEK